MRSNIPIVSLLLAPRISWSLWRIASRSLVSAAIWIFKRFFSMELSRDLKEFLNFSSQPVSVSSASPINAVVARLDEVGSVVAAGAEREGVVGEGARRGDIAGAPGARREGIGGARREGIAVGVGVVGGAVLPTGMSVSLQCEDVVDSGGVSAAWLRLNLAMIWLFGSGRSGRWAV